MRVVVFVLACMVLASGMLQAAETRTLKPTVDELTRQFEEVVFGREFQRQKPIKTVIKWVGPLRVAVKAYAEISEIEKNGEATLKLKQKPVEPLHLEFIQKHLETLTVLTGLETENFRTSESSANFTIKFVPRSQLTSPNLVKTVNPKLLRKLGAHGGCYFLTWHNQDTGHIERVEIIVNTDRSSLKTDHCLLEEMSQSLGFFNDVKADWQTIFSNSGPITSVSKSDRIITSLPRSDRIIIRTLYDVRIKPAMKREKVLELARKIIGELDRLIP